MKNYRGRGPNAPPKYKEMDINRIQEKLKAISESIVDVPKYINQIEKELGISQERLRRRFPDLIKLISSKNKDIKHRKRIEYIE